MILLTASLSSAPWALICMIISLILLFLAAFTGPPVADGPFYRRINLFVAGVFFFVLSVAIG